MVYMVYMVYGLYGLWFMVHSFMDYGAWLTIVGWYLIVKELGFMADGGCYMVYGVWCMVYGVWCMVYGLWFRV
jgi:membrane-bound ClpP family serine protease